MYTRTRTPIVGLLLALTLAGTGALAVPLMHATAEEAHCCQIQKPAHTAQARGGVVWGSEPVAQTGASWSRQAVELARTGYALGG